MIDFDTKIELEQLEELTLLFLDTWCEPAQMLSHHVDGIAAVQQREQFVAVAIPAKKQNVA